MPVQIPIGLAANEWAFLYSRGVVHSTVRVHSYTRIVRCPFLNGIITLDLVSGNVLWST